MEEMLEEKKAVSADYDAQIAKVRQEAAAYKAQIKQQNAELKQLDEEENAIIKAEEERRKKGGGGAQKAGSSEEGPGGPAGVFRPLPRPRRVLFRARPLRFRVLLRRRFQDRAPGDRVERGRISPSTPASSWGTPMCWAGPA